MLRSLGIAAACCALAAAALPLAGPTAAAAPGGGPDGAPGGGPGAATFRPLTGFEPTGSKVRVRPREYAATRVDTGRVRATLAAAPKAGAAGFAEIGVPTPVGGTERFAVQRTQVMGAQLAQAHPDIGTWSGHSLDHPGTSIALDVTPMGFHASVRPADGRASWYVDPAYNRRGTTTHLSYVGGALPRDVRRMAERELPAVRKTVERRQAQARAGSPVRQRVYRLALVTDPTYAAYFGAANVTAEKVTLVNRVNQVYNDDLAVNLVMVGDDALNLDTDAEATGANGPCGAHPCFDPPVGDDPESPDYVPGQLDFCDVPTLQRNQVVLGQLVGASGYDIGHIMLGVNGGGIAGLAVVGSIEKGMGCTGLPDPTGDFMAIDYVAHEMGHQFGGNHTFNGVHRACSGGNRNDTTSVEPGSGSSVMAYAGICAQDDLQPHSDPYFSQRTVDEVADYTGGEAAPPVEVQDVSLRGFDTDGDTVTIGYPGKAQTFTLVRGGTGATAYTAANIESAVEALTETDVTVAGWGYDPYAGIYDDPPVYPAPLTEPDDTGFEVMFASDPDPYTETGSDREDMADLQVSGSAGVEAHVGETAKGGAPGNQGFRVDPTANQNPVVRAPADRTIPVRTPFTLTGRAWDQHGDHLVYLWEQNDDARDHDGTSLVSNAKRYGPLFRVFGRYADVTDEATLEYKSPGENIAGANPTRTFPDLAQVVAGNTNARTGRCPAVPPLAAVRAKPRDCYSEFLPTRRYAGTPGTGGPALHFRLTARDRVAGGGGVGHDDVTLRIDRDAGPFLVSSFRTGGSVAGGSRRAISWRVNGTRRLAGQVRILLSTDDGRTWRRVLAGRTANDGRATVRIPDVTARKARVMVAARGNYFFDVSDAAFRVR